MIFGIIKCESIVQLNDKTRIEVDDSFISPDEAAITLIEIQPSAGDDFQVVTSNQYLDWAYTVAATNTVTLRITTDGSPQTFTASIVSVTSATDRLFSNDNDIYKHESDLDRFLPAGKSSFNYAHRASQGIILDKLAQRGIYNTDGTLLTKDNIYNIEEVRQWSKYLTLSNIYYNVQNEVNDVFAVKAKQYADMADIAANKAILSLDFDADGTQDKQIDLNVGRIVRR